MGELLYRATVRCRTASNRAIPAVVAALRLSPVPAIGKRAVGQSLQASG